MITIYSDKEIEACIDCGKSQSDADPTDKKRIAMLEQCYKALKKKEKNEIS